MDSNNNENDSITSPKYVVVEFPLEEYEGTIPMAIISSKWIITKEHGATYCLWPNLKSDEARIKAVRRHDKLDSRLCTENLIRVKYSSVDYQKTMNKLKLLESYQSVSESDTDNHNSTPIVRNRRPNTTLTDFVAECSSGDENIPKPPRFPKKSTQQPSNVNQQNQKPLCATPVLVSSCSLPSYSPSSTSSQPQHCKECHLNKALLSKLLEDIRQMKNDIDLIKRYVATDTTIEIDVQGNTQIATKDDLIALNTRLEDKKEMQKMVSILEIIGGKDVFDTSRRIMSKLLTNSLACEYNWTGQHSKGAFSQLKNIRNLITVTVRRNKLCAGATEDEVEKAIKLWIRNAADRDGGRSSRKRKSTEQ